MSSNPSDPAKETGNEGLTEGSKAPDAGDKPTATDDDAPQSAAQVVEAEIAPALEGLPPPRRQQILHKIEETLTAFVATSVQGGPKMDAESVRVLAATVEKDNENKFKYLCQKEQHEAEQKTGELGFRRERHRDHVGMLKPVIIAVLAVVIVTIGAGLWFIAHDREAIGIGILTSVATASFGFLGGLGVSNFFRDSQ